MNLSRSALPDRSWHAPLYSLSQQKFAYARKEIVSIERNEIWPNFQRRLSYESPTLFIMGSQRDATVVPPRKQSLMRAVQ